MRICAITTNANETGKGIDPARVIKHISDDYDKRMLSKNVDKKSDDQAFAAQTQKRKKNQSEIECHNCKKPRNDKSNDNAAVAAEKTDDIESWAPWALLVAEDVVACRQ
jgi:hypothetical protein